MQKGLKRNNRSLAYYDRIVALDDNKRYKLIFSCLVNAKRLYNSAEHLHNLLNFNYKCIANSLMVQSIEEAVKGIGCLHINRIKDKKLINDVFSNHPKKHKAAHQLYASIYNIYINDFSIRENDTLNLLNKRNKYNIKNIESQRKSGFYVDVKTNSEIKKPNKQYSLEQYNNNSLVAITLINYAKHFLAKTDEWKRK